jgi:hypothetical protein
MSCTFAQSEAARKRHPSQPGWLTWHVLYGLQDARNETLWQVRQRLSLPWLTIVDLADLPALWQRTCYTAKLSKADMLDIPYVLGCLESDAQEWLA